MVNHVWLYLVSLVWVRLDCIWADGLVELYLVGQTWSWAKLGLVKFEVGLGWVEFGGDGWV